jgi:hypothetical protein
MGGCFIIGHKVKHVLHTYFLKTEDCEGGPSYIWVKMVNIASETVLVVSEYLCRVYDMQFNMINHTICTVPSVW